MPSVRRSIGSLAALALASLAVESTHAQVPSFSDLQIRADSDTSSAPQLPELRSTTSNDDQEPGPRPPPPGAKPPPLRKAGDLPPLKPYAGAQRIDLRGGTGAPRPSPTTPPIESTQTPGPTVAAPETPPPRRKIVEDPTPFDPIGLRIGTFDVKPYVEQDVGYASNPLGLTASPKGSGLETTEAGVSWQSIWSRDDIHGQLKGGYTDYFQTPAASGAYGSGTVDGRLDATHDLAFDAEGRFSFLPEPLSNFGVSTTAGNNPYIETSTYGGTLGATQKFGEFSLALHGSYDRQDYQNAPLGGIGVSDVAADDYSDWGLKLRGAYRLSEAISPYVEVDADTRRYDNGVDAYGYQADSTGVYVLAGVTLSFSQMLSGELALGYGERTYQDPRLPHAQAPLVDASLIWAATPLTTLTIKATTALNDAILQGASADINHAYSIDIAHALTRQWLLGLTGTYSTDSFVGSTQTDQNWSVGARAEYHVTRDLVFKVTAAHTAYATNQPGQNNTNNSVLIGVRLQR